MNIAITGEGIVSAIGKNKQEVLLSLLDGRTGIGKMKHLQSVHHELPVAEVDLSNEEMKSFLGIPSDKMMSRTALLGMLAIDEALKDAHIDVSKYRDKPLRIVLVSGTTVGGMDITELCFDHIEQEDRASLMCHHDCGHNTLFMSNYFGIFSDVTTLSTACSSAANAIMFGARLIEAGQADMVVAGGTEALTRFHLNGFNSLMILDDEQCRPFDETRAGINLGEGAAFLVLESEQTAKQRGVSPHAYLTGYGNACDAFHQTASSENGQGAYLAMKEALHSAHLSANDIQYINAHGTGTPNNDQSESVSLRRVFGDNLPLVSSTKSFTGHTTSASGGIEAVICLLAIENHFVPANLGWSNQMKDGITPTLGVRDIELRHVLCNSFGFGGNDTSLVISSCPTLKEETVFSKDKIKVLSKVEITSIEQLSGISKYVKPLESRRMGKIMKSSLLSSLEALEQAGIKTPEAIITATAYGCLENSERLLYQIRSEGEVMLKPTYFMQSTHNTIGSNIAIKTHCYGYNVTYTQESHSLDWAIRDAEMLLRSGKVKNVLVGCHDESTLLFDTLSDDVHQKDLPGVHSVVMVLSCGE